MENEEKGVFFTHDIHYGVRHGGRHDVAEVSHNPTVTKPKSPHFVKVVFATGGMVVSIPYRSEAIKMVEEFLPITTFFSLT